MNEVSQVAVAASLATETSGRSQTQPLRSSEAVRPSSRAEQQTTAEVSRTDRLAEESSRSVDDNAVEEIVEDLNQFVQQIERELRFTIDDDSGETIIKVIDSETHEVIRQIPREEIVNLRRHLGEVRGMLFKTEA